MSGPAARYFLSASGGQAGAPGVDPGATSYLRTTGGSGLGGYRRQDYSFFHWRANCATASSCSSVSTDPGRSRLTRATALAALSPLVTK